MNELWTTKMDYIASNKYHNLGNSMGTCCAYFCETGSRPLVENLILKLSMQWKNLMGLLLQLQQEGLIEKEQQLQALSLIREVELVVGEKSSQLQGRKLQGCFVFWFCFCLFFFFFLKERENGRDRCFLSKCLEELFHFGLYRVSIAFFTHLKEFLLKENMLTRAFCFC